MSATYTRQYESARPDYARLLRRKSYYNKRLAQLNEELIAAVGIDQRKIQQKINNCNAELDILDDELNNARIKYNIGGRANNLEADITPETD